MAVINHELFRLSVDDFSLVVNAPDFILPMLKTTLRGWKFSGGNVEPQTDIYIQYDGKHFYTDALILDKAIKRTDIIHTLNDFFLTVSYLYKRHFPKYHFIHCAAYSDGQENILLLGNKKSGKSFMATLFGINGGQFIADDLLLWNPRAGNFIAIGLPPRLRRPIHTDIMEKTTTDSYLTGHDLAYMKTKSYEGVNAGRIIEFDRVRVFDSPQVISDVKLHNYAKEIRKRQIRSSLWDTKKDRLDLPY